MLKRSYPQGLTKSFLENYRFYSKSKLDVKNVTGFNDLYWKQKFSNFWGAPFKLYNVMWPSVEHYYQYSKYYNWYVYINNVVLRRQAKTKSPEIGIDFNMVNQQVIQIYQDSILVLSQLPKMSDEEKRNAGLSVKKLALTFQKVNNKGTTKNTLLRYYWTLFNTNWNNGEADKTIKRGIKAKFTQNADLKELLVRTGGIYLSHYSRFVPKHALASGYSSYKWGEMITSHEVLSRVDLIKPNQPARYLIESNNVQWKTLKHLQLGKGSVLVGKNEMGWILMDVRGGFRSGVSE